MKTISWIFFVLYLLLPTFGQAQIIFFEGTWEEALQEAQKQQKKVFVDVYTTWCAPCKWLDKEVFSQAQVGDFFNQHFISYKINAEKGEGIALCKQWYVKAYPTLLYFSSEGVLEHRFAGAMPAEMFLQISRPLVEGGGLQSLQEAYRQGQRSPLLLRQLALALYNANEYAQAKDIASLYWQQVAKTDWPLPEHWPMAQLFVESTQSELFQYLYRFRARVISHSGQAAFEEWLGQVLKTEASALGKAQNEAAYKSLLQDLPKLSAKDQNEALKALVEFYYYQHRPQALPADNQYLERYCQAPEVLDNFAWFYYENENDKSQINKAITWAERSVSLKAEAANTATLAHLYFKKGEIEKAKTWAEKALLLAKKEGENSEIIEVLLQKISE